jgi:formate-dependent nitrite reductase cytochrome c552 subunit
VAILLGAAASAWWLHASPEAAPVTPHPEAKPSAANVARHAVHINPGPATPTVLTNALNRGGEPVPVSCSTCHTTRPPNLSRHTAADLTEFHQGLAYQHGGQSCLSCHNATNYDTLRKADGTAVAYPNVIELCAQCHGPQYRDYQAGAHGGMNGHWDLTRGPRERNTCVNCHDPHAPAYPRVKPVFAPVDRGARQQQLRSLTHETKEPGHD